VPRIVVGVDGSAESQRALAWALDEARRRRATLQVVHAWKIPQPDPYLPVVLGPEVFETSARTVLREAVAGIEADPDGPAVETELVCDSPAHALLDAAKDADLLVVGSHGRGGFAGMLLGSVSQHVLHHATCPVVVVRGTLADLPAG
jgi:nucleotide-binding universal stress UspA family protein